MTHDECRSHFPAMLYHEIEPAVGEECARHMSACAPCADAYRAAQATLRLLDRRKREEPAPEFWETYWSRIEERIAEPPRREVPAKANIFPLRISWAYGAAAILLVGFGIYLGRTLFTGAPAPSDPAGESRPALASAPAAGDSLAAQTQAYLERTKVLLQGIVNEEGHQGTADFAPRQRELSRRLISEAHVLTAALREPEQRQIRELIADLQIILLQLANIEVRPGQPAVELVRQGVQQKSIFLKIHLEELRTMAHRPAAVSGSDSAKPQL